MLLLLMASGLSLIFSVLGVRKFRTRRILHARRLLRVLALTVSFALTTAAGALGVALFGTMFEQLFMSRV